MCVVVSQHVEAESGCTEKHPLPQVGYPESPITRFQSEVVSVLEAECFLTGVVG